MPGNMSGFADYKDDAANWITLSSGEYYPDILSDACLLYEPALRMFARLLKSSETSDRLFLQIAAVHETWMRIQLCRIFRKYVSPQTPVEMLKRKTKAHEIVQDFGAGFRPVNEVQARFDERPMPDEVLCALLWEYKNRGAKGYDLTERFFDMFNSHFPDFALKGPKRAGQDIRLGTIYNDYPNPKRPVDFVVYAEDGKTILAIGFARYDGDRGGAQEDDRTGGYKNAADEILRYAEFKGLAVRVIFINDGPGLLLGSMWDDYASLEQSWQNNKIMVTTLRMIPVRLTESWLRGIENQD